MGFERLVLADFDGNGLTDIAETAGGAWRVSWDGRSAWQALREVGPHGFDLLSSHLIGEFDATPGADALRYQVFPVPGGELPFPEGNRFELSSGASSPPAVHSRYDMR